MATRDGPFAAWLSQAGLRESRLTTGQVGVLKAVYQFRERCGDDYYSTRLLSHFLLHAQTGLKVAQIARLLKLSRPTASRQQRCSSKEAIQAAHHRMAGRPHGRLLPRYAGPIAEFILAHPDATRHDTLDFIERTWGVRVSAVALYRFCKKFGLDRGTRSEARTARASVAGTSGEPPPAGPRVVENVPPSQPVPLPPPPFSRGGRSMRGRSC